MTTFTVFIYLKYLQNDLRIKKKLFSNPHCTVDSVVTQKDFDCRMQQYIKEIHTRK